MNPDLLSKKKAIHYALCTVLTEEEAESAINSWMQNVSSSASIFSGLNLFARNVCETYGKNGRHAELLQAMSRALMTGKVEPEVPVFKSTPPPAIVAKVNEPVADSLSGPEISTPEFKSFQPLLRNMLYFLTQHNDEVGKSCREFLLGVVANLPWSEAQQEQVVKLIKTGSTMQTRPYRAGQLKILLHHLSLWMAEELGNESADRITHYAVGETERNPVSVAYSPREFFD